MKGIINVTGKDHIGIIANICTFLYEKEINILQISQDIIDNYFNMIMIVDISKIDDKFEDVYEEIQKVAETIGVQIKLQRSDIFDGMHRI